jgi:hypothetical protein
LITREAPGKGEPVPASVTLPDSVVDWPWADQEANAIRKSSAKEKTCFMKVEGRMSKVEIVSRFRVG